MSRSTELTKKDLIEAAVAVFAAKGYDGGSVRDIALAANANQAAISYHFGGKDGLYRAVLTRCVAAFDMPDLDPQTIARLDRAQAVRIFLRNQLSGIARHDALRQHLRIFAWENLAGTAVFRDFIAQAPLPIMDVAAAIVRRFLPHGDPETIQTTTIWLLHQAEPFTRNPDRLKAAPLQLNLDALFLDRLVERLHRLVVGGLESLARETALKT